ARRRRPTTGSAGLAARSRPAETGCGPTIPRRPVTSEIGLLTGTHPAPTPIVSATGMFGREPVRAGSAPVVRRVYRPGLPAHRRTAANTPQCPAGPKPAQRTPHAEGTRLSD